MLLTMLIAIKGAAVDTALVGRVLLVRSHLNAVERAVILFAVMVSAIRYGAVDRTVGMVVIIQ